MIAPARRKVLLLCLFVVALGGCGRTPAPAPLAPRAPPGPVETVRQRLHELDADDLSGHARRSVPPALYAGLEAAWEDDRTRWPLSELPLDERLPALLGALSAPGADRALLANYQREFAGAHKELRSAATTLGLLGLRYLRSEQGDYSADERAHYLQLVEALSDWGRRAPLGDARLARAAIVQLTAAARGTGLTDRRAFRRAGLRASLRRLGPFSGRLKRVLAEYGLDVDAALAGARVDLLEQRGDRARVRVRYTLAGHPIDAAMNLERIDGRWYLSDTVAHARAEVAAAAAVATR